MPGRGEPVSKEQFALKISAVHNTEDRRIELTLVNVETGDNATVKLPVTTDGGERLMKIIGPKAMAYVPQGEPPECPRSQCVHYNPIETSSVCEICRRKHHDRFMAHPPVGKG